MSEKRFEVVLNEFDEVEYIMDKKLCEDKDFAEFMDFVEELAEENKTLKAQLYCEGSVCTICKHQQLTPYIGMRGYYTAKCEKGHKECSKEDLKHCKDFKLEGF